MVSLHQTSDGLGRKGSTWQRDKGNCYSWKHLWIRQTRAAGCYPMNQEAGQCPRTRAQEAGGRTPVRSCRPVGRHQPSRRTDRRGASVLSTTNSEGDGWRLRWERVGSPAGITNLPLCYWCPQSGHQLPISSDQGSVLACVNSNRIWLGQYLAAREIVAVVS
jgi:hypothetical protein